MALSRDIALFNNDLLIINGDLAISESDVQHVTDTINAFPGWWKQYPADGVGLFSFLNSSGQEDAIAQDIKIQLQADGYQVSYPSVVVNNDGTFTINPNATKV